MQRNLMMVVYPRKGGAWRRGVEHIVARASLFNGRKSVAIGIDDSCDDPDEVAEAFGSLRPEISIAQNTELQEVQQFLWLLESTIHEPGITLYCHAKGATHAPGSASHLWCDAMAEACLDYPRFVQWSLGRKPTCGAFRSTQAIGWSASPWHFAGTWWWVRNDAIQSRNWGDFEQQLWGTESYPGRHFGLHESTCLLYDQAQTAHLYDGDYWRRYIGPSIGSWRSRLRACGLQPLCEDPPTLAEYRRITAWPGVPPAPPPDAAATPSQTH